MQIRPAIAKDLDQLPDIDGTVESSRYLHLEQAAGEGLAASWSLEERPLRQKLIDPNRLTDETTFLLKQIVSGADEGMVLVAEHDEAIVAVLAAHARPQRQTLHIVDLRIDYEQRRQGIGTAMLYQLIGEARELGLRAVSAETRTNNLPANQLLAKCGFELSGVDTRRHSNHDVVKEAATLFWYAALD
ncbi:MAG: GNAT family N-acetyltransferase [Tepidisphaeraceae bacterium]